MFGGSIPSTRTMYRKVKFWNQWPAKLLLAGGTPARYSKFSKARMVKWKTRSLEVAVRKRRGSTPLSGTNAEVVEMEDTLASGASVDAKSK